MIPKKIHYCWFGRNPKSKMAQKCIKSWKQYCPDYEIIEWNEDNYDLSQAPLYVQQAYEARKWAFVTDYVRLQVVYENGGIYLDTDVELTKNLDDLLCYQAYFGFENGNNIATGLGFGAIQGCYIVKEIMEQYSDISFYKDDGSFDTTPCPARNTKVFMEHGLVQDDSRQMLDGSILILPTIYLCPYDFISTEMKRSKETMSIHWYGASWQSIEEKRWTEDERKHVKKEKRILFLLTMRYKLLTMILGEDRYRRIKSYLKGDKQNADD